MIVDNEKPDPTAPWADEHDSQRVREMRAFAETCLAFSAAAAKIPLQMVVGASRAQIVDILQVARIAHNEIGRCLDTLIENVATSDE